ncbi:MAG: polymerase III subunit beta protein [Parcubacteria group bacterium GW2011_GWA2_47_26]|nr:MAG: polymerase III subunit beta protein [Parcubacteria group bacterium GW2011_GWA2_47_26]
MVSRIASRAGNLPILSNIYLKTTATGLELRATNLEIGLTCMVRGKVEEVGEFTVPARLFSEYIALLPKDKVDLVLAGSELQVVCGKNKTKIKGMPAVDFPVIPQVENGEGGEVSLPALMEALEQVLFTISPNEGRPEISGALIVLDGSHLTVAGTDSYRLAEKALITSGTDKSAARAILPLRALQELVRVCGSLKEEAATAKIIMSSNQFALSVPTVEFVSRLIEGQYPDYKAIIPTRFGIKAKISRAELASALKAAGLFSKTGVYDVAVSFNPEKNEVEIASLNSQTGEHASVLPAEVQGVGTKIAFNWKYLLDGVQALRGENIIIKATDSASPTMLTEEDGTDYFYIVMPIKE